MKIQENIKLAKYSTYKTGGVADYLCEVSCSDDAKRALEFASKNNIPSVVISGGSNILISDKGYRGLVIINRIQYFIVSKDMVDVGAGVPLQVFINKLAKNNLSGLEKLSGIPGRVGGAIIGNAGANGVEISNSLLTVTLIDAGGKENTLDKAGVGFTYRNSSLRNLGFLTGATFKLKNKNQNEIQQEIIITLENRNNPKGFSCGSFFKNPEGKSAGQLIDEAGLKGRRLGGAAVSSKHANYIINNGNAKSTDIYELSRLIKKTILEKDGINLEEEVQLIGDFN